MELRATFEGGPPCPAEGDTGKEVGSLGSGVLSPQGQAARARGGGATLQGPGVYEEPVLGSSPCPSAQKQACGLLQGSDKDEGMMRTTSLLRAAAGEVLSTVPAEPRARPGAH